MIYGKNHIIKNYGVKFSLIITFLIAGSLNILPLPYYLKLCMPNWLVLVLLYWIIFLPGVIGLNFTLFLGLIVDLLLGNLLGLTSLYLLPITFLADRLSLRFKNLSLAEQFLSILVLISINHVIRFFIQFYLNYPTNRINYWLAIPTSIIVWPLLCGCLNLLRKAIKFC